MVFKSGLWYKKYKNGFVEQGGNITSSANIMTVLLLVEMSNTQYQTFTTVQTIGNYFLPTKYRKFYSGQNNKWE